MFRIRVRVKISGDKSKVSTKVKISIVYYNEISTYSVKYIT